MFKKILIVLLILIVAFVVVVALQPGDMRVSRSAVIPAAPAVVFDHVNDLHKWQAWSPWARLDPNATNTFEGPTAGKDAAFSWSGNMSVGEGTMTITESHPAEAIGIRLDFRKPMAGTNDVRFTFKPDGAGATSVTWEMAGKKNFVAKAMGLFMDCEKMCGDQFEAGFANLKEAVAASPAP
ncbi:MAG: SRPBCC family protein [Akkermansiaceae bacterium]|nr:SRPBCC family protein [Akkermansiaceae bacterium]